ncbi:SDR family NAD(P)-dependent oxidoreductase [Sphingomonadaceae bacterium G21617-S1]|nr:SDR family NAD(P)-dependent oxidoreductase [Sphingomonadaceae bacterium G21617-S1]
MKDLSGRVAVVTGAGTGMGRSIALSLAGEGVNVVVADIEKSHADSVRDEAAALGVDAISVATDVSKLDQVQSLADAAYGRFGKVDILVNNAGVTLRPFRAVWDTAYEDFKWVIDVNIWGVIHGIHVFVPRMREQSGEKHIVNVSSMGTLVKVPGHSTYTLTKAAVNGFSDVIREELANDGFGVTILYPGYVMTRIATSERLRPEAEKSANRNVTPYESYTKAEVGADGTPRSPVKIEDAGRMQHGLDPNEVGPMVVKAIIEKRPYCLTHPAPEVAIRKHSDELLNAYLG